MNKLKEFWKSNKRHILNIVYYIIALAIFSFFVWIFLGGKDDFNLSYIQCLDIVMVSAFLKDWNRIRDVIFDNDK